MPDNRLTEIERRLRTAHAVTRVKVAEYNRWQPGRHIATVEHVSFNDCTGYIQLTPSASRDVPLFELLAHAPDDIRWLLGRVRELEAALRAAAAQTAAAAAETAKAVEVQDDAGGEP